MASIRKFRGKWRAEIARSGIRKSKVFDTKAEAVRWANVEEVGLVGQVKEVGPKHTLEEALDRYTKEVSVNKKGHRFERLRLEAFIRDFPELASKKLSDLSTPDFAGWRDKRLKVVSKGSVQRDINLLSHVFSIARDEWHWLTASPLKGLRAPGDNPPRTRLVQPHEVKQILRWCHYQRNTVPKTKTQEVGLAFLLALRTGMRAGEILSLSSSNVDLKRQVTTVEHKTQHITGKPREVPLSKHAVRILKPLIKNGPVFTISSASLDALFRKAKDSLLLKNLHFHDTRGTALTRFTQKKKTPYTEPIDVLTLAKISGHRDLKILLNTYYRETADSIAQRI